MTTKRLALRAAVYLMLFKDKNILLLRRFNTGWQDGKYSLISGHLSEGETVIKATIREAKEEAGIDLKPKDLYVVHTMYRKSNDNLIYIDFFLIANEWEGNPKINEPDKCDEIKWLELNNLPENLLPHVKNAIDNYKEKVNFSEFGWGQ